MLLPLNRQLAFARSHRRSAWLLLARRDLDTGLDRGRALQVFEGLFDVTQIQKLARRSGQGIPKRAAPLRIGLDTNCTDAAWYERQAQDPRGQVLLRRQHTGGDEAPRDDRSLNTLHDSRDALTPEATMKRRVCSRRARPVGGVYRPVELFGRVALERDANQGEARGLTRWQKRIGGGLRIGKRRLRTRYQGLSGQEGGEKMASEEETMQAAQREVLGNLPKILGCEPQIIFSALHLFSFLKCASDDLLCEGPCT